MVASAFWLPAVMLRLASASVLIALVIAAVWIWPPWVTTLLAAAIAALAGWELARFGERFGAPVPLSIAAIASASVVLAFSGYDSGRWPAADIKDVLLAHAVVTGAVTLAAGEIGVATFIRFALLGMAPLYVGLPLGALAWIHASIGPMATLWLIGTIAASDSAQYYTGRMFGRRKLAPAVSPAKTREGAIGGLIAAGVAGACLGPWCLPSLHPAAGAAASILFATGGIVGDLFESLLKRSAGVKDSSGLIPGHGGVLDRIDSYLFAAPLFYALLRYVL